MEVREGALLHTLKDEVIGDLIVNEGFVDISADQDGLVVSSLNMTGGNIHSSAGGKLLVLRGNVTATSSPSQQAAIIEPSISIELSAPRVRSRSSTVPGPPTSRSAGLSAPSMASRNHRRARRPVDWPDQGRPGHAGVHQCEPGE